MTPKSGQSIPLPSLHALLRAAQERCRRGTEFLPFAVERGSSSGDRLRFEGRADQLPSHVPRRPRTEGGSGGTGVRWEMSSIQRGGGRCDRGNSDVFLQFLCNKAW